MKNLNSDIDKTLYEECKNNDHPVLLFLGLDRDDWEGRSSYVCHCLNCGKNFEYPTGDKGTYQILEGNFDRKSPIETFEAINSATNEYQLFRDCYYKYPKVLKEKEHSNRIIYKAMKKRYEANK